MTAEALGPPGQRRDGAKALAWTILGEFVLPGDGAAWTSTLVDALGAVGVNERNARQALARLGEDGIIGAERFGRRTRWHLTERGRATLETGARRIYAFGGDENSWAGEWLVVHCPVPEPQRHLRHQLQRRLSFVGFGFVAPGVALSPHADREEGVVALLAELGLDGEALVLRSRSAGRTTDADLVARAWDLASLGAAYGRFTDRFAAVAVSGGDEAFAATVELVHGWRRFPFVDPELPTSLLPRQWAGRAAHQMFVQRRQQWAHAAQSWFATHEAAAANVSP